MYDKDHSAEIKKLDEKLKKFEVEKSKKGKSSASVEGERVIAEIIAAVIFGVFAGYNLDVYLNTKPIFLILFVILCIAVSFYNIYKGFRKKQ
jgi:F0F1-type ATP synthase assembly protein I